MPTRLADWSVRDIPSLAGRRALVTGATQGLGYQIAAALAGAGASVILAARTVESGQRAVDAILQTRPAGAVDFELVDLARLSSVRRFADRVLAGAKTLDLLVNNAGILAPTTRRLTEDGLEAQFQINYLGHFLLTALLLPALRAAPAPRVTHVSSLAHRRGWIDLADLQSARRYLPMLAYAQSKLANLLFTFELQRRSDAFGWGLTSTAGHPGIARTNLVANSRGRADIMFRVKQRMGTLLTQSAAAGALPVLYAATSPDVEPMGYYGPRYLFEVKGPVSRARAAARAKSQGDGARLWEISEALAGVRFPSGASASRGLRSPVFSLRRDDLGEDRP